MTHESNPLQFSNSEKNSLSEAIRYYRSREGNFSSNDPLVELASKLNSEKGTNLKNYNSIEISDFLKVIDENVRFILKYEYPPLLPPDSAQKLKKRILDPLNNLRTKISKEL